MAIIVGVHGIGQQLEGEYTLRADWFPAMRSGLNRAGADFPNENDLACAFYGDLFRSRRTQSAGDLPYDASDVKDEYESELLEEWWREAANVDRGVPGPAARGQFGRTSLTVQRALNALSYSRFFTGILERTMIGNLKQVRAYLNDDDVRSKIQECVARCVGEDTRVVVGHSLGAVVAYEAVAAHPEWPVTTLVTIGAPLGVRNLIFHKLEPVPRDDRGAWPADLERWTNIADERDVVALVKKLRPLFGDGERIVDYSIDNEAHAHDAKPYLTAMETGRAILAGLKG